MLEPREVKWRLMVASCYRRSGNYQSAFEAYKRIHRTFPDDVEALRFLVRICTDRGLPEAREYMAELQKIERAKELSSGGAAPAAERTNLCVCV